MKVARTLGELRAEIAAWRKEGRTVALVPTMGALHVGHLTLVREALTTADRVAVSIFVNPTQFGPNEDLARYPRDEEGDLAKLKSAGANLVWLPTVAEMYPEASATRVEVKGAAIPLEGEFRPHHFNGVATIVLKLFTAVQPDTALFGEKDFQQLAVIRQMVRDLNVPVAIRGAATVREDDGLALSSRNAYLSKEERRIAPRLNAALRAVAAGESPERAKAELLAAGFTRIDYLDVRDAETLQPYDPASKRQARVLAAAWLGSTRLIDNIAM